MEIVASLSGKEAPIKSDKAVRNAWQAYTALADKYNEPGRFTAIIGFEWTAIGGDNLHRNVLFRGNSSVANRTVPYSQFDSQNPEDLWKFLADFEQQNGAEVLAIPHNGNLSNGRMFTVETFDGKPLTRELAALRARFEPIIEATQIKGDSESHPFLSPSDEFADYEKWDQSNLNGTESKKPEMLKYEYAREALKTGLALDRKLGVNPFKFGMIGSTDAHTSLAAVEEDNFFGKHSGVEPGPHRWEHVVIAAPDPKFTIHGWQQASAGYAGVWATENTREAIFDAMKRKETYATTGPRMVVRFFGGWDFTADDARSRLPAGVGYAKGVPMGGDLRKSPAGKSPTFLVAAHEGPLQRQPRSHPDHQGLAGPGRQDAREGVRRRVERRSQGRRGRQVAACRQHRRRGDGHLDEHHRRAGTQHDLDRSRLRREAARLLLRARHRDPDAALDRVRSIALRRQDDGRRADDDAGARLHVADLVHAVGVGGRRQEGQEVDMEQVLHDVEARSPCNG